MASSIAGKSIVLGVCGGIAAYKSVEVLRQLIKEQARVRVVMTRHAESFVGPLTFQALSKQTVCSDLFDARDEAAISHIQWAQEADGVVIAPATANMIGKLASGLADDALSTFMLAVTAPVMICPSMNTHMYESRAVQRNLNVLRSDGCLILEPGQGELACGTTGPGRLPEPEQIVDRLISYLTPKDLSAVRILVTAGPTREIIDPVRFISNPSTGKMGYALARAAERRGAQVTLISGPTHLAEPSNVRLVKVGTAGEMAEAVFCHMDDTQVVIKAAAVSDYRPAAPAQHKMKKDRDRITLELEKNQDILKEIGRSQNHPILVGFAAETQDLAKHATTKLADKNLDLIVGNLIGPMDSGFQADTNRVTLFHRDGRVEPLEKMSKADAADMILDRVKRLLGR
jgi:phosphopantothenoylcysteine decarboxylase / phosphopantothenate---cysteine ligase